MLVKNWMIKDVKTVDVNDSMADALRITREHKIRMLPVMKNGNLVGVITDRDLKRASASDANTLDIHEMLYLISRIKIKKIMTKDPITVPPDYTVEETAELLLKNRISGVPVMKDKKELVGIITQVDIFRVLISLAGVKRKGVQFGLLVEDLPGSIKEVTDIIRNYGGRLASILSSYDRVPEGMRNVYIRAYDVDRKTLPQLLAKMREKADLLYMVDHLSNERQIY